ncbi:MAG: LysR family transcriptional regulator [Methylomonas lenta]|nr:LysR family transcriptional regulator [Methylomonas lenta]
MTIEPNDLWLLAKIADCGSFSKASAALGLPKSTLSRRISQMETQLGERVFQRTTRQLNITELGLKLLQHGRQVAEEVDAALALAQHRQLAPSGNLRISLPNDLANQILLPLLADFIKRHPAVTLEMDLSARHVDLLSEQFDLVIRMGDLADDTQLAAKPLFCFAYALYATPEYLQQHGTPETPADLLQHTALLLLTRQREPQVWFLSDDAEQWSGVPPVRATANSPALLLKLAQQHLGIVAAPNTYAKTYIEQGKLQRVLPAWHLPSVTAWAVFPGSRLMPRKTRALIDFLQAGLDVTA